MGRVPLAEPRDLPRDDALDFRHAGGAYGQLLRRFRLHVVNRVQRDAGNRAGLPLDVARHGQVDGEQWTARPGAHHRHNLTGRDDRFRTARRRDDDVGIAQGRVEGSQRKRTAADLTSQRFGMRKRAVDDDERCRPCLRKMPRGNGGGLAGADDDDAPRRERRRRSGDERGRGSRGRRVAPPDTGFPAGAASRAKRGLEQPVDHGIRGAGLACRRVGRLHLPPHLHVPEDRRVDAARDAEQMPDHVAAGPHERRNGSEHVRMCHTARQQPPPADLPDGGGGSPARRAGTVGMKVQLRAAAGGDARAAANAGRRRDTAEQEARRVAIQRERLPLRQTRRVVRDPDEHEGRVAHGAAHSPSCTSGRNAAVSPRSMKSTGSAVSAVSASRSETIAFTRASSTRRKNDRALSPSCRSSR